MKKRGKFIIAIVIVIIIVGIVGITHIISKETTVYSIKSDRIIEKDVSVTEDIISAINDCNLYTDDYLENSLPGDKKSLADIEKNINTACNGDVFFAAFEETDFQNRLENDNMFYKNKGVYDEHYIALRYYEQLMIINLKIKLKLGEFEEFKNLFIENFNAMVITTDYFPRYLVVESEITDSSECLKVVMDAYDDLLDFSTDSLDTYEILASASRMAIIENADSARKEEYNKKFSAIIENNDVKEYIESSEIFNGFSSENLNKENLMVYERKI